MSMQRDRSPEVALERQRPGDGPLALDVLYEQHGAALFRLAYLIRPERETACRAVVHAFATACTDPTRLSWHSRLPAELVRLVCEVSASGTTDLETQRRAMLALTLYGDHTYDEAGRLLGLDPSSAADHLRVALHQSARSEPAR